MTAPSLGHWRGDGQKTEEISRTWGTRQRGLAAMTARDKTAVSDVRVTTCLQLWAACNTMTVSRYLQEASRLCVYVCVWGGGGGGGGACVCVCVCVCRGGGVCVCARVRVCVVNAYLCNFKLWKMFCLNATLMFEIIIS